MTISTPRTEPTGRRIRSALETPSGFTLTEVLVAATLSTFIMAGVLSAFLWIGRGGFAASSYSELESETRRALEVFGEDARRSTDVRWNGSQNITLWIATASNATTPVTYAYDPNPANPTHQCFYRVVGEAGSTEPRRILIRNVAPDFEFKRFKLERPSESDNTAANDMETKQIEVSFRARRIGVTAVASNQAAHSARYVLRNKRVSN